MKAIYKHKTTLGKYRHIFRPDEDIDVFDPFPLVPPIETCKNGHRFIHDYHREIAWAIDYRGVNDDIPTLLYAGAGYTLIKKVFMEKFGKCSCLFSGMKIYRDFYIYQRQRKAWVRMAVELRGFNSQMMTIEDLGIIMERAIKATCWCNIKKMTLYKLLNV